MKRKTNWTVPMGAMLVTAIIVTLILVPGAMADKSNGAVLVNINTADTENLTSLPSIGISKANAIVEYRLKHGPFTTIDELINVNGIGSNVLEKIRDFIKIQ